MTRPVVIDCACSWTRHMLVAHFDHEDPLVYLAIHLDMPNLWTRLMYLLGRTKKSLGGYEETVLTADAVPALREIIAHLEGETHD